jgi:hypothetical protein
MRYDFVISENTADALLELPAEIQRRVMNSAMKKSNEVLREAYQKYAPSKTGALLRGIDTKIKKYQDGKFTVGIVGIDWGHMEIVRSQKGKSRRVQPARYAHLIDGGTTQRKTKKGQNRGRVRGNLFIHQIQESTESTINQIIEDEIAKAVKKY